MAVPMGNLDEALKLAGAGGESAHKAAEEVASYENRMGDLRTEIVSVRGELAPVKWMLGFNLAMTLAIVGKLFLTNH